MAKKPSAKLDESAGEHAKPRGKKKLVLIGLVALLAVGGGGWFALGRSNAGRHAAADARPSVAFLEVPEITVNLAADQNQERARFLKLRVALEVRDSKIASDVQPLLPRVEDIFQVFMRGLRASDLEGSGGIHRLREELLRRVNLAVAPSRVEAVLFKEVVVQ